VQNIPVLAWGSPFVIGSSSEQAEEFGWSLESEKAPPFSSPFPEEESSNYGPTAEAACIVMLIEDNPADANLVHVALLEHGVKCELVHVKDGEEAVDFIDRLDRGEAPCPDLVILDLNLPRKPGSTVLKRVRESEVCGHIPVVVLTSSNDQKDRDEAKRLGASLYIRKPSRLSELMSLGAVFKDLIEKRSQ
jgi:CheY-like chemotaxis protein